MSKIETLRHLPTPAQVRENVQQLGQMLAETLQRLDSTVAQVQSLEQLPDLVADQVIESLAPILTMRRDVMTALEQFDNVSRIQRQSLEQLGQELVSQAAQTMEGRVSQMDQTLKALASQAQGLRSSMTAMEASAKSLQSLPASLAAAATQAAVDMKASGLRLSKAAQEARPSVWLTLGQMLGTAILGALLVPAGQAGLNRILPPPESSETQKNAALAVSWWAKATTRERELLKQISSRPGP